MNEQKYSASVITEALKRMKKVDPITNPYKGFGRNKLCSCGSGKKYKKCCLPVVLKTRQLELEL